MSKNLFQSILIFIIEVSFSFLYVNANYKGGYPAPTEIPDIIWGISQAAIIFLFCVYGVITNKEKNYKAIWGILSGFFLIRFIWEISSVIQGIAAWEKVAMGILFALEILVLLITPYLPYIIKTMKKCLQHFRQNGV